MTLKDLEKFVNDLAIQHQKLREEFNMLKRRVETGSA